MSPFFEAFPWWDVSAVRRFHSTLCIDGHMKLHLQFLKITLRFWNDLYYVHILELLNSMEFRMDAENALKLVIPVQAERALFISNLGQGRSSGGGFSSKIPPQPHRSVNLTLYFSHRQTIGHVNSGVYIFSKNYSAPPPLENHFPSRTYECFMILFAEFILFFSFSSLKNYFNLPRNYISPDRKMKYAWNIVFLLTNVPQSLKSKKIDFNKDDNIYNVDVCFCFSESHGHPSQPRPGQVPQPVSYTHLTLPTIYSV